MTETATPRGSVQPLANGAAWRVRDEAGRLLGVYPTEAAARRALAQTSRRPAGAEEEAEAASCASPPCLGCFD